MEVFSWRSGQVGFGRTEHRSLQRSKTSSGDMSQSCPYHPGQVLCWPTSTQVIQGSNCLSIGPKVNNKRMTIEHDLCARSRARFVPWPYLPVNTQPYSSSILKSCSAVRSEEHTSELQSRQ